MSSTVDGILETRVRTSPDQLSEVTSDRCCFRPVTGYVAASASQDKLINVKLSFVGCSSVTSPSTGQPQCGLQELTCIARRSVSWYPGARRLHVTTQNYPRHPVLLLGTRFLSTAPCLLWFRLFARIPVLTVTWLGAARRRRPAQERQKLG